MVFCCNCKAVAGIETAFLFELLLLLVLGSWAAAGCGRCWLAGSGGGGEENFVQSAHSKGKQEDGEKQKGEEEIGMRAKSERTA